MSKMLARLGRFSFTLHNLIGHPASEILHLIGATRAGDWVHDVTLPAHEPGTGRG